jgi:hypothetical protein
MTEYRIVELHRRFHIEERINGKEWHDVRFENVPRYFDSLADARSWVATIKRGVVYHDARMPQIWRRTNAKRKMMHPMALSRWSGL